MNLLKKYAAAVKSILVFTLIAVAGFAYGANELKLADKGKTEYVIVESATAIPAEKQAAKDLSAYLQKVTGATFQIVSEKEAANAKCAIYVGATDFAAKQGIKPQSFAEEEWVIRAVGKNLIISGGHARGTLYGTYEFLEKIGCHWFDEITETVPNKPVLSVPAWNLRSKPAFQLRMIYTGTKDTEAAQLARARNKDTRTFKAELGFSDAGPGHTFYSYSRQFPKDRPEFHAMNIHGERPVATSASGPGQICLTNPDVRKLMVELLIKNIESAKKRAAEKAALGEQPRKIFYITPNDTAFNCQCPPCKAFMKKEGTDSALYVDFVNYLADAIKDKYPDVILGFFAYENNIKAPKRIRPRDNTMVCFAQLNAEWKKHDAFPDLYRPMTDPVNEKARVYLEEWTKISKNVEIWDYWIQFVKNKYPFPNATLDPVIKDIQWFHKNGVDRLFTETEIHTPVLSFHALTCWVGRKLLCDPKQDPKQLIGIFMKGYYGPAAEEMTKYLNFLQKSIADTPRKEGKICGLLVSERSYLNYKFYKTASAMLDAAEKKCPANSLYLLNVQRERLIVDAGIYCMWEKLQKQLPKGEKMPWKAADLLQRFKKNRIAELTARPYLLSYSVPVNKAGIEKYVESEVSKLKGFHAAGKGGKPLVMTIPRKSAAVSGDPATADWNKAAVWKQWFSMEGNKVPERKLSGKVIMDEKYLYLLLEETGIDLAKLNPQWWSGDAWELFFSTKRSGVPYKQLAINSDGKQYSFTYTDNMAGQQSWKSGVMIKTVKKNNTWTTQIALPLASLMTPDEIAKGSPIYMNVFRSSKYLKERVMCISPIFDANFHDMTNLAEMIPAALWPAKEQNLVSGKAYTVSKQPNWSLCNSKNKDLEMKKLTDGVFYKGNYPMWFDKKTTFGYAFHGNIEITFDLGKTAAVEKVLVNNGYGISGVERPRALEVQLSMDGKKFKSAGSQKFPSLGNIGYRAEALTIPVKKTDARYVKVILTVGNWYLCFDEIAVQGEWK